jgi:hypothetical protein
VQAAVAQHRILRPRQRPHRIGQADLRRQGVQVAIAAGDELRAAVEDELAAPLAAHPPAGHRLALEHLHRVPAALQPPGARQPGNAAADHHHPRHGRDHGRPSSVWQVVHYCGRQCKHL